MSWSIGTGVEGKGVVVTGAGGGIGREIAAAFAAAGAHVCAVDVNEDAVREVVEGLEGGHHLVVQLDVRDIAGHESVFARAHDAFG